MRDLALPLSILALAGVLALDHLPSAHAQAPTDVRCTIIDRAAVPKNIPEKVTEGLVEHAGRPDLMVVPLVSAGNTFAFLACSSARR